MAEKKYKSLNKNLKIPRYPERTAVTYIRVSTGKQVENYSIPTQLEAAEAKCKQEKLRYIGDFVEEGESAKTAKRSELSNLLHFLRQNKGKVDFVIFYKLDRGARNQSDYFALKSLFLKYGANIISATEPIDDSPTGRFLEGVFAAVAQLDNELKGIRVRDCMVTKALDGWHPAGAKYGYINNKTTKRLDRDPSYFIPVQTILKKFTNGASVMSLVDYLNNSGLKTRGRNGYLPGPFNHKIVTHILKNSRFYAGYYDWHEHKNIYGKHEKMITWEEHLKIASRFTKREPKLEATKAVEYLLNFTIGMDTGFLHCEACGKRMLSARAKGNGGYYFNYYCHTRGCSVSKKSIHKDDLEKLFDELIFNLAPEERLVKAFKEVVQEDWAAEHSEREQRQEIAKKRLEELTFDKKATIDMYRRGKLAEPDYDSEMERIQNDLVVAQLEVNENQVDIEELNVLLTQSEVFLSNLKPLYLGMNIVHKRQLALLAYPNGLYYANGRLQTKDSRQKSILFTYLEDLTKMEADFRRKVSDPGIEPGTSVLSGPRSNQLS